jgi:F420-0:gamma-glutamyl ligase
MGQGKEAMPVAIIRGVKRATVSESSSSKDLVIGQKEDLFQNVW